jgi:hypothetical protein
MSYTSFGYGYRYLTGDDRISSACPRVIQAHIKLIRNNWCHTFLFQQTGRVGVYSVSYTLGQICNYAFQDPCFYTLFSSLYMRGPFLKFCNIHPVYIYIDVREQTFILSYFQGKKFILWLRYGTKSLIGTLDIFLWAAGRHIPEYSGELTQCTTHTSQTFCKNLVWTRAL